MAENLRRLHSDLKRGSEELDSGRAKVSAALQFLEDEVERLLAWAPSLRRLRNALERAAEDLPTARVLVDAALEHIKDQIEEFLIQAPEEQEVG